MGEPEPNQHFVGLLLSLHSSAWIHLGKVTNPTTGKSERNLEAAREMIDLLGALDEKTRGNRVGDEDKLLTQLLTELRMNYVDELERSKTEAQSPQSSGGETAAAAGGEPPAQADAADAGGAEAAADSAADEAADKQGG